MHRISRLALLAASGLCLGAAHAAAGEQGFGAIAIRAAEEDWTIPKGEPLMVTRSGRVQKGEYLRPPLGEESRGGVIVLEKLENVTLDLTGVVLSGAAPDTPLDKLAGFGVVVRECKNVTIHGGTISGYGACVVVSDSQNVVLDGIAFDRWYGMRLLSTPVAENDADWLWPHENDQGQWLKRYGGAISISDCSGAIVRSCRGRHGQNGILMLRCETAQLYDNDFSFLSGWGLALYRSSQNIVSRNIFDYCVRGYSHEVYWRGEDSAAILMFERCSDNVLAYNSATHSGDGIFLFAGRDSVEGKAWERGEKEVGGCDRNLFYGNDFSYAVANGIEATFSSDNVAVANQIRGCHQHGIWGGYSRRMQILENQIEHTLGGAITVEHGQEFLIAENVLHDNQIAVELYWDEDADLVGGPFGKHFDTSSSGHALLGNSFSGNDSDFAITRTTGVTVAENVYASRGRDLAVSGVKSLSGGALDLAAVRTLLTGAGGWSASGRLSEVSIAAASKDSTAPALPPERDLEPPKTPGVQRAFDPDREDGAGLETIVMGEWGPWDFRSGEARPVQRPPGGLLAPAQWEATWFSWKDGPDPRGDAAALQSWRALAKEPLASSRVSSWSSPWAADPEIRAKVGTDHFGLLANTRFELQKGRYRLAVVSDDGVRLKIDGIAVLENWTWHGPTRDTADIDCSAGEHLFELEYFQIDGASALSLDLERLP